MSLNKYTTEDSLFFVDIIEPSTEEVNNYYSNTGEIKSSGSSKNNPKIFKKAIIKFTCDAYNYPIDSEWIMGESPGTTINFFGEKLILIQQKDLYARIN